MKPSLGYCLDYAEKKGVDPYLTVIDADQESDVQVLFTYVNNYASGGFGVPWNLLLVGASMEYYWSSTSGAGDLYGSIDALVARCETDEDCFDGATCKKENDDDFEGACE